MQCAGDWTSRGRSQWFRRHFNCYNVGSRALNPLGANVWGCNCPRPPGANLLTRSYEPKEQVSLGCQCLCALHVAATLPLLRLLSPWKGPALYSMY